MPGYFLIIFSVLGCSISLAVSANEEILVGKFSQADLADWEEKSFKGNSRYEFIDSGGVKSLSASTEGMVSLSTTREW